MLYERFAKRMADKVAKKARKALLEVPFYRQKLRQNKIDIHEVKGIKSVEKLDEFLNKYRNVEWVSDRDLANNDLSLQLSTVPQSERIWVQASSGYEMATQLRPFLVSDRKRPTAHLITRKKVAFTKNDLKKVIANVYRRGLNELVRNTPSPAIAIFATLSNLNGSGTFPLIGISGGYSDFKVKTLYFGNPLNDLQAFQWLAETKDVKICGILSIPRSIEKITRVALSNGIKFEDLIFISSGGDPLPEPLVKDCHEIGARIVIVGYSVQEVMPLGAIASGVASSVDSKLPTTSGLIVLGNLCFVRVTDKDGYTLGVDEEGIIRVTAPFEGTTLIDYNTHDIGRFMDLKATAMYRGKSVSVPFPVLDFDIRRDAEFTSRVLGNNIPTALLQSLCFEAVKYDFLLSTDSKKLYVFLAKDVRKKKANELRERLRISIPQEPIEYLEVRRVSEEVLRNYVYPLDHHKPHNVVTDYGHLRNLLNCSSCED